MSAVLLERGKRLKIPSNWMAALGIAMSIPSTIFIMSWLSMKLIDWGYLSKTLGVILFISIIVGSLILLVWNGVNKKNRP